jgi:hypothetical protein
MDEYAKRSAQQKRYEKALDIIIQCALCFAAGAALFWMFSSHLTDYPKILPPPLPAPKVKPINVTVSVKRDHAPVIWSRCKREES